MVFGEMAVLVLYGIRLSPEKIIRAGYTFRFTKIREALEDLLAKRE
jgi:NAD dependent epimerase/dehydratase family enzyme